MAKTPCDYGECPYNATEGFNCRDFCGLGVDETYNNDDFYGMSEDRELINHLEGRMDMSNCYSPSAPWYAPGMSVKDFI